MSSFCATFTSRCGQLRLPKRRVHAHSRVDRKQGSSVPGHLREAKRFLLHGIRDHDDAVAKPGKQLLKVVPKTIVERGTRDIELERQRASKLKTTLRGNVKRHDDAIAASGRRVKRLPSVQGLVDKGMQDIQTVASSTRAGAPLSEYSEIWTFPFALVTYSTMVIAWSAELAGSTYSSQLCGLVGFTVGAVFSFAHRAATLHIWKSPSAPLNVVVTGGTRGIGKAIVREHLLKGDNVFITSRNDKAIREAVSELQEFTQRPHQINGFSADVSIPGSVDRLARLAQNNFADKTIDVWINNAGVSGSFKSFLDGSPEDIARVARTNLLGALLCTRAAIKVMEHQDRVGHVFNMDGAGADGVATPQYAAYGATKAGIAQVMGSIAAECREKDIHVGVHTLSPGMVLTQLILDGATNRNKQVFNILCEQPEVVAAYLVPRARSVAARSDNETYIRFLTSFKALTKFLSAPFLLGRYFTNDGKTAYNEDVSARLDSKATARAMQSAGAQSQSLRYAYASTLCLAVMALSIDPATVHVPSPPAVTGSLVTAMLEAPDMLAHIVGR